MKSKETIGSGYKAGVGNFKVYLTGPMQYDVRNGHNGPVVGTKSNLSSAATLARYFHENPSAAAL